jgi:hypothetical protein
MPGDGKVGAVLVSPRLVEAGSVDTGGSWSEGARDADKVRPTVNFGLTFAIRQLKVDVWQIFPYPWTTSSLT